MGLSTDCKFIHVMSVLISFVISANLMLDSLGSVATARSSFVRIASLRFAAIVTRQRVMSGFVTVATTIFVRTVFL